MKLRILSIFGTRPEAIKMAPVLAALRRRPSQVVSVACVTAQHRLMLDQVLDLFDIRPDYDLDLMDEGQSANGVFASTLLGLERILRSARPDWVLAQGDTTTAAAAAVAAFHERVQFGHIEAGLRTQDLSRPFPEEFNRRVADMVAARCFAPTPRAVANLAGEGVAASRIVLVGNTGVDALLEVAARPTELAPHLAAVVTARSRLILVTAHRRESFGEPFRQLCLAVRDLAQQFPDVQFLYPVHLNPQVRGPVHSVLVGIENVELVEPLDYASLVHVMQRAFLVLTDSGGIQEEAPALGRPVLVLRDVTERPEGIQSGAAVLVGTHRETIVSAARALLDDPEAYARMAVARVLYGDGRAAERVVASLLGEPVAPFVQSLAEPSWLPFAR